MYQALYRKWRPRTFEMCIRDSYIATRERVELLPDDRPPTRKQEQLINKLTKDFPDSKTLYEYEDYAAKPTKFNACLLYTSPLPRCWRA